MSMNKTFLGFGLGPIQSGLFLYEAHCSGNFSRFVIAEVDPPLLSALKNNGGRLWINIARKSRIDPYELKGIEVYNPATQDGRTALVEALSSSDEMATALPSVDFYTGGPASPASLVAEGLARRARPFPSILYAAENHNHAAEIFLKALSGLCPPSHLSCFRPLNTVIGKMSGVITDPAVIARMALKTVTPGIPRAILIEEFNRILISRIDLPGFKRGIEVFVEKPDLLPFEEAKLYGHNAIHALIAYLADLKGIETIAQAGADPWIMRVARDAFLLESGGALVRKYSSLGDPLFTEDGYRQYADDLLDRMTRPTLNDLVSRVGRDHLRKLGYDDRLFGAMRLALDFGIIPSNLALGAAACLLSLIKRRDELASPTPLLPSAASDLNRDSLSRFLAAVWAPHAGPHDNRLLSLTLDALSLLRSCLPLETPPAP